MKPKNVIHFDATNLSTLTAFRDREIVRELNEIAALAKLPTYTELALAAAQAAGLLHRVASSLDEKSKRLQPAQLREFAQRIDDVVDRAADDGARARQREIASNEVQTVVAWLRAGGLGDPF